MRGVNSCSKAPLFCALLLSIGLLVSMSGCGIFTGAGKSKRGIDSAMGADPSVTPFRLDVLKERNDGESLKIDGQIVSKSVRGADDVLVRLTAVDSSGEQRVSFHRLIDLINGEKELKPKTPTKFSLAVPSNGISNYQLEVLWGKDAEPFMADAKAAIKPSKSSPEFLALRNLEVHRVPDGSCSSPEECLVTFSIKGEFFNSGRATIRDVVLIAGFSPAAKLDLPTQKLENERRIEVRNVQLAPQATKPFRLTLEKILPASDTVAYQPVVRIISFESDF